MSGKSSLNDFLEIYASNQNQIEDMDPTPQQLHDWDLC